MLYSHLFPPPLTHQPKGINSLLLKQSKKSDLLKGKMQTKLKAALQGSPVTANYHS